MVDDTRLELVTSRTSSGCATSCANRPSAWIEYTRFAALSSPFPGKCEKIFCAIPSGEPCGGRGTGCRGRQPLRSASLRSRRDEHCSSVCPSRARVRQTGGVKPLPYACGRTAERDDLVSLEAKAAPADFLFSSRCAPCRG